MTRAESRIIKESEANFIRFQLSLKGNPREVKAALQRLCSHYENGYRFFEPQGFRLVVRGLLAGQSVAIRRWVYKALALFGEAEDVKTLTDRCKTEPDPENQAWAMAAIIALAKDGRAVEAVCKDTGAALAVPLLLAARLYAPAPWLKTNERELRIDIDRADHLTLKWAALLAGYGRAPENLFDPRHENRTLLGELNSHPHSEVSEYSVWALWQNPGFAANDLRLNLNDPLQYPENVRRWINRLLTKTGAFFKENRDQFEMRRADEALVAREGLALGLRHLRVQCISNSIMDWHDDETEEPIRALLLEHMAYGSDLERDFCDIVERSYRRAGRGSSLRSRLLSASEGRPLYGALRKIDVEEEVAEVEFQINRQPQLLIPASAPLVINVEKIEMTNFNAGRDINGQNLVGGNMVNSANGAVQGMPNSREAERAVLADILSFVQSMNLDRGKQGEIIDAVEVVAKEESKEAKQGLLSVLKKFSDGGELALGAADKIGKFIDVVGGWIA